MKEKRRKKELNNGHLSSITHAHKETCRIVVDSTLNDQTMRDKHKKGKKKKEEEEET